VIGELVRVGGLFAVTAVAEILGCYLAYLWLRKGGSVWLVLPSAVSLGLFAWLLALHPGPAGRTYAAYGAVYVGVALLWLAVVEGRRPDAWDVAGVASRWSAWPSSCSATPGPAELAARLGRHSGRICTLRHLMGPP
jgi:small multidrug resistance family-3 protein